MSNISITLPLLTDMEKIGVLRRFKAPLFLSLTVMTIQLIVWPAARSFDIHTTNVRKLEESLAQSADIIYMGDSVLSSVNPDEENQQIMAELLASKMSSYRVADIHQVAAHPGLYKAYVDYISQHNHQPKLVIVPINLRAFGPQWSKRPSYQFNDVIRIASESHTNPLYHIMETLAQSSYLTEQDYLSEPVYNGQQQIGTVRDFDPYLEKENPSDELKANVVIMNYMYSLSEDHLWLKQLVALVETARYENIPLILYVTPIDWQQGEHYHGTAFTEAVNRNLQLILDTLAKQDTYPLNMAFDLEHEMFDYRQYVNEHLYFAGRDYVTEKIANALISDWSLSGNQQQ